MAAMQVDSADVIRLIQQFLREHDLHGSLAALQEESGITLNTVESVEKFTGDVQAGRWEGVLGVTQRLTLPASLMQRLMGHIVLELAEAREFEAARAMLRGAPQLAQMKRDKPERYLQIDHVVTRAASSAFDAVNAYGALGREGQRKELATELASHVQVAPPSRLLTLLTQSLKYQQLQGLLPKGGRMDLFRGAAPADLTAAAGVEAYPTKNSRIVKFGAKSYPECARFSPDGLLLASGSCDGYIELWDAETGKLQLEFAYQADDQLMSHDSAVLCLAFSTSMELLATGSAKGDIKVWRLATGSCVRKFATAHAEGITQLEFLRDGSSVLSSSFDGLLRAHGLKSGRTLKEFRGHTSFVTAFAVRDETAATHTAAAVAERVLSTSADGTVRVWDMKTQDCLRVIRLHPAGGPAPSLLGIHAIPTAAANGADRFALVERSGILRIIDAEGTVLQLLQSTSSSTSAASSVAPAAGKAADAASASARKKGATEGQATAAGDFVCAAVSAKGKYLYGVTEECVLHCFDLTAPGGAALVHAIKVHRADVIGIAHHPHRSLLASYAQEGNIKLWTP